MGPPLDHHRHIPRRTGACSRPHHGWRVTPTTCLPTVSKGSRRKPRLPARRRRDTPTHGNVRLGFVYERVPHITLKSIANNAEIDVIWERWQETLEPLRTELNDALGRTWEEWEIPREPGDPWPDAATSAWNKLSAAETGRAKETALRSLNRALKPPLHIRHPSRCSPRSMGAGRYRPSRRVVGGPHCPPA